AAARHRSHTVLRPYVVQPGDALYLLAQRFHVPWQRIARINHLPPSLTVVIGDRLWIPHRARGHHRAQHRARHGYDPFRGGHVPSRTAVVKMLRDTAHRWHVDMKLVLGVSYEEAGFNQHRISSVGAVGAMQIMPATGAWISEFLGRPLNIYRAR